jgi:protein involved in temperature-dependent protein secretion
VAPQPEMKVDLSHLFPSEQVDDETIRSHEQSLRSHPKDQSTRWKLVQAYAVAGKHIRAIQHCAQLIQSGEYVNQAVAYLETITTSGVQSRQAYQALGDAYFKSDRLPESLDAYRKALSLLR